MSDLLSSYDIETFRHQFSINSEHSLDYIHKQIVNQDELFMTIHVTNECLKSWYEFKNESRAIQPTFVDILNAFLGENHAVLIKKDCTRIEDHIRRLTSTVKTHFRGLKGHAYIEFAKRVKKIAIRRTEVQSIAEIEQQLHHQTKNNKILEEENKRLRERCEVTYQSLIQAVQQKDQAEEKTEELQGNLEKLMKTNDHLYGYIQKVEELQNLENNSKKIVELQDRQKRRKIKELKTKVERTLWFAETFGLTLSLVEFKDENGINHTMEFEGADKGYKSYKDLPQDVQDKIKEITFITDKFCISEAAYHELTLTSGGGVFPGHIWSGNTKTTLMTCAILPEHLEMQKEHNLTLRMS